MGWVPLTGSQGRRRAQVPLRFERPAIHTRGISGHTDHPAAMLPLPLRHAYCADQEAKSRAPGKWKRARPSMAGGQPRWPLRCCLPHGFYPCARRPWSVVRPARTSPQQMLTGSGVVEHEAETCLTLELNPSTADQCAFSDLRRDGLTNVVHGTQDRWR
ncbi:hypothetical protein GQ53DRAFT_214943 [Thozetella sp. PMI_491]|nr:hypothetical protein GQ53DRAFT_214943 [Thozetella sp. PMI_491]